MKCPKKLTRKKNKMGENKRKEIIMEN